MYFSHVDCFYSNKNGTSGINIFRPLSFQIFTRLIFKQFQERLDLFLHHRLSICQLCHQMSSEIIMLVNKTQRFKKQLDQLLAQIVFETILGESQTRFPRFCLIFLGILGFVYKQIYRAIYEWIDPCYWFHLHCHSKQRELEKVIPYRSLSKLETINFYSRIEQKLFVINSAIEEQVSYYDTLLKCLPNKHFFV